jgi:hypothetical protein
MELEAALARLNSQLPLKARREHLPPALKAMHQRILASLVTQGRPPTEDELEHIVGKSEVRTGLQQLAAEDLVVLDQDTGLPLGAYPLTTECTPHRIRVNGQSIFAMCALDAVAVAPMFNTEVQIDSSCHVTHTPIMIRMRGSEILAQEPGRDVTVGIRWQMPTAVAAHSMCMQMLFLKDRPTALAWQAGDTENIALFALAEAVQFGKAFFLPLLD